MVGIAFKRATRAFLENISVGTKLMLVCIGLFALALIAVPIYDAIEFGMMTPAEHLANGLPYGLSSEAERHFKAIPKDAPEYAKASERLREIAEYREAQERAWQSEASLRCTIEKNGARLMSLDGGESWHTADSRCDGRFISAQKKRDSEAEMSSYVPTTVRVDTDMDSFWLDGEERLCQTLPDATGRVAVVACNQSGSHRDRNIPVRFWGGVDRGIASDWKCRREGNSFACRAVD